MEWLVGRAVALDAIPDAALTSIKDAVSAAVLDRRDMPENATTQG
jgi:hypothetical protein